MNSYNFDFESIYDELMNIYLEEIEEIYEKENFIINKKPLKQVYIPYLDKRIKYKTESLFFIILDYIEKNPNIVKKVIEEQEDFMIIILVNICFDVVIRKIFEEGTYISKYGYSELLDIDINQYEQLENVVNKIFIDNIDNIIY